MSKQMLASFMERLQQAWHAAEPAHAIPATMSTSMFTTCRYRTQQIERLVSQQSSLLKKLVHAHSNAWKRYLMWRLILRMGGLLMWGLDPRNLFRLLYRHTITTIILFFAYSFGRTGLKALLKVWRRMWEFFACRILRSEYHLGRRLLYRQMKEATSYVAWEKAARKLDKLEGKHKWREESASDMYNFERIDRNIHILRQLLAHGDSEDLMYYLRSRLNRNLGNIAANELYTKLRVGTKRLIEDYNVEVQRALEMICADPSIAHTQKLAFIKETRHSYGRTALLLSGGGTMGLYHLGVIKALHENNLLPQVISGSSAGSIFAALVATRTDQQIAQMGDANTLELSFFPNHGSTWKSLSAKFRRFLTEGVPLDIEVLAKCVRANVGDVTFQEAYDKYGRIINITVTPTNNQNQPLLLNFLTSPNVLLWSAAVASCAIPGIYQPVQLMAKNKHGEIVPYYVENVLFMDGSVALDLPLERLRELFNVNHFIVSQVNPHVVPFLFRATSFKDASPVQRLIRYLAAETNHLWSSLWDLSGITAQRLSGISGIVAFLNSLTTQQYQGDITLVPRLSARDYGLVLVNPTVERMVHCCGKSRAYTWTRMNVINGHCELEFALDRCVRRLRGEIIYEAETRKTKRQHNMRRTFARQYRPASSQGSSTNNAMAMLQYANGNGSNNGNVVGGRSSFASRSPRAPARIITSKPQRPEASPPARSSSHSSSIGAMGSNDSITRSAHFNTTNTTASTSRSRPVALAAAYLDNNHVNHHPQPVPSLANNSNGTTNNNHGSNMSRKVVSMLDMRHYGNAQDEVGAPELEDEIYTRGGHGHANGNHHHRSNSDAYGDEDEEHKVSHFPPVHPSRSAMVSPVRITGTSTKAQPVGGLGGRSSSMVALSSLDKDPLFTKYADLESLPGSPEMRSWQSAPSQHATNGQPMDDWRLDQGDAGSQQHYCDVFHVPGQRCNECGQLEDDVGSSSAGGKDPHGRAHRSSSDDDDDMPPSPVMEDMIGMDHGDMLMMNNRPASKDATPDSTPAIGASLAAAKVASTQVAAGKISPLTATDGSSSTAVPPRRRSPARSPTLSSVPRMTPANATIRTPPLHSQQSSSASSATATPVTATSTTTTIANGHYSTPMSDRIRSWSALDFANQGKWQSMSNAAPSTTIMDASITKAILQHNPSPISSSASSSASIVAPSSSPTGASATRRV